MKLLARGRQLAPLLTVLVLALGTLWPLPPAVSVQAQEDTGATDTADGTDGSAPAPTATPMNPADNWVVDPPYATPTVPPGYLSATQLASLVDPSLVEVQTADSAGSGVVMSEGIVTAAHLVGANTSVQLWSATGQQLSATVLRTDASRDLALLSNDQGLPALPLTPSQNDLQGDEIFAFAYPPGAMVQPLETHGLLSTHSTQDGLQMVQTDAPLSPGSSGGALVDHLGNVIGVVQSSRTGMGLGIASETVSDFLAGAAPLVTSPFLAGTNSAQSGPFAGSSDDVAIRAADLGPDWTQVFMQHLAPDAALASSTLATFQSPTGGTITSHTLVFRSRAAAQGWWSGNQGGSLEICEASDYVNSPDGSVVGACLVQNVAFELAGGSLQLTQRVLAQAGQRVKSRLPVAPTATPATPVFRGSASAIIASAAEVGAGWTVTDVQQDRPNEYSSGLLRTRFTAPDGNTWIYVSAEVYRDVPTAQGGFTTHTQYGGQAYNVCDAGWVSDTPGGSVVTCRTANVELQVAGGSLSSDLAILAPMQARVKAGLR